MKLICILLFCLLGLGNVLAQALFPYQKNGLYGYKNRQGKIVVPAQYNDTWRIWHSTFKVVKKNGKVGLIDAQGNLRIPIRYDAISEIIDQKWISAQLNGRYGFLDPYGNTLIPFDYDYAFFYNEEKYIMATKNNKWGLLDTLGQVLVPFEYDHLGYEFGEGLIAAEKNNASGFIDLHHNVVVPFIYDEVGTFSEGLALAGDYRRMGYINRHNDTIIPFEYQYTTSHLSKFTQGWALARKGRSEGYIGPNNEVRIPFKYNAVGKFHKGFSAVYLGDGNSYRIWQYGYVDSTGKEYLYPYPKNDNMHIHIPPAPQKLPDHAARLEKQRKTEKAWTLESLLEQALMAFRLEPVTYPDLDQLNQIGIAYGFMLGGGNYGEDFMFGEGWETFKKKTLFPIFSSEFLRQITWDWIGPLYKEQFQTMNPFEKKAYREIAEYLRSYINRYDRQKTEHFLDTDEARFAYYNADGQPDKHRKISAFVDRLILVHGLVSEKEAKHWINKLADEVAAW